MRCGLAVVVIGLGACSSSSNNAPVPTTSSPDAGTLITTPDAGAPAKPDAGAPTTDDPCTHPKPGPDNTGVPAGTQLKPSKGITVDEDGAIVEDLDIAGEIMVQADNVTIRRVKITSGDYYPIRYDDPHTGLVIEDSEIVGTSDDVTAAVSFGHYTARRLNIHGSADGFKADEEVLIEDCWIHDLRNGPDQHNDGMQNTGGANVTLRHNSISGASNACVQTGDENGQTVNLVLQCNWFEGGGYSLNIRGTGARTPTGTKILGNRFVRNSSAYGPMTIDDKSPTVTGNVWDDDGSPVDFGL